MIRWRECFDDNGNSFWEASSPYHNDGCPIMWRLKQRLVNNHVQWYEAHDAELIGADGPDFWPTLKEAKKAIAEAHKNIIETEC